MDKLKLYAAPIVALVLMLVWLFVVRPMMSSDEQADKADSKQQQPASR